MSWKPREIDLAALGRIERELIGSRRFRLLVLSFGDTRDRDRLIEYIERDYDTPATTLTIEPERGPRWLEASLARLAQHSRRIHVIGFERLGEQRDDWLLRLNYGRESIAASSPATLLFWMFDEDATALARVAPDLWAWRSGVYEFPSSALGEPLPAFAGSWSSDEAELLPNRLQKLEEALASGPDMSPRHRAALHTEAAKSLLDSYRDQAALDHIERARRILEPLEDARTVARLIGMEGRALSRLGRLQQAEQRLVDASELLEQHGSPTDRIIAMGDLASLRARQGQLDGAIELLEGSLELAIETGDKRGRVRALENLAELYATGGDLQRAISTLEDALRLAEEGEWTEIRANTLRELGRLEALLDRGGVALQRFEEALVLFDEIGDQRAHDINLGDIAYLHARRGEHQRALEICQDLLERSDQRGDKKSRAYALGLKGRILDGQGHTAQALVALKSGYQISVDLDDVEGVALLGRDYGQMLIDSGSPAEAREVLECARDAFARGGNVSEAEEVQARIDSLAP